MVGKGFNGIECVSHPTPLSLSLLPPKHAHAAENVLSLIKPGARVLDVGSGSGYFCAILHELGGHVVGIDHIPRTCHLLSPLPSRMLIGCYLQIHSRTD